MIQTIFHIFKFSLNFEIESHPLAPLERKILDFDLENGKEFEIL